MRKRTLSAHLRGKVTQGLRQATIRSLGYDRRASRSVSEFFDSLAASHAVPKDQIRIRIESKEIRTDQSEILVRLFISGSFHSILPNSELIRIFAGAAATQAPGLQRSVEAKVGAYLAQIGPNGPTALQIEFRNGSLVLSAEQDHGVLRSLSVLEVVEHFYSHR